MLMNIQLFDAGGNIWRNKGEAQEAAKEEFIEILKELEGALGEKDFFGGDAFGFVDILAIALTSWFWRSRNLEGSRLMTTVPNSQPG